jgi:hypothetical protein
MCPRRVRYLRRQFREPNWDADDEESVIIAAEVAPPLPPQTLVLNLDGSDDEASSPPQGQTSDPAFQHQPIYYSDLIRYECGLCEGTECEAHGYFSWSSFVRAAYAAHGTVVPLFVHPIPDLIPLETRYDLPQGEGNDHPWASPILPEWVQHMPDHVHSSWDDFVLNSDIE